jgi:hypothetical protein
LLLSGIQFLQSDVQYPPNVRIIRKIDEFIQFANQLTATASSN